MSKKYFVALITIILFSLPYVLGDDNLRKNGEFRVDRILIKYSLEPGESVSDTITITSYKRGQDFNIFYNADFISVGEKDKKFTLLKDESKIVNVLFDGSRRKAGVYVSEILVSGEAEVVSIPVILELETQFPLFDVSIEVSQDSLPITAGEDFVADINVYKLKGQSNNVRLEYLVRDTKEGIIFSEEQELEVSKQVKVRKTIPFPSNAEGDYVFSVIARDENLISVRSSSLLFSVLPESSFSPKQEESNAFLYISFGIIVVLVISFLVFNYFWDRRIVETAKHWNRKIVDINKIKSIEGRIRKFSRQSFVLDTAYRKGYIKKESYEKGKKEINRIIGELKKRL